MASHPAISATSFPAMSSLTYEQLQQLYVKNKAELTKHVNEAVGVEEKFYGGHDWFVRWWESPPQLLQQPGSTVSGGGGVGFSPLPSSLVQDHNGLEHQTIPASEQSEAVNMVKNRFRRRLQRFNWVTGPHPQPDLERVLESSGFSCQEEEPVMCADLTNTTPDGNIVPPLPHAPSSSSSSSSTQQLVVVDPSAAAAAATTNNFRRQPPPPPLLLGLPEGVIIEPMSSLGIISWVSTWAHGAPECDVLHWTKVYARVATTVYRDQFRMFAARKGAECVGTGYLHCYAGVASIHSLFVTPAYRRQGIGKALAAYAMQDARGLGYKIATLTASAPALSFLTQLGFKEFGAVKLYTWYPVLADTTWAARDKVLRKNREVHQDTKDKEQTLRTTAEDMEKLKIKEAEEEGWEFV